MLDVDICGPSIPRMLGLLGHEVHQSADTAIWMYTATDYDNLYDSPFECGTHQMVRFFVADIPHDVAIWGHGNEQIATLIRDIERIVVATHQHFVHVPYHRYLFILHLADGMYGGLEHCNSTVCLCDRWGFAMNFSIPGMSNASARLRLVHLIMPTKIIPASCGWPKG